MKWQPIETAPKDGRRVLLHWPYWSSNNEPVIGSYDFNHDVWDSLEAISIVESPPPTHWMPLPDPPQDDES